MYSTKLGENCRLTDRPPQVEDANAVSTEFHSGPKVEQTVVETDHKDRQLLIA